MKKFMWVLMLLLVGGAMLAQEETTPLLIRSVGLLDEDGTVLYSVFLVSGEDALEDVSASVEVPDWMTLAESVSAPEAVEVTVEDGTITWSVDELEADTLLGPLTYRVEADFEDTKIPAVLAVQAAWADGEVELAESEAILEPFETTGEIVVDAEGTVDEDGEPAAVEVGETGLWIYIPAGAVTEETTLTFERLPVPLGDEAADFFPADAEGTWWCSVVSVSIEPGEALNEPVMLAIPSRRVVTPGLASSGFVRLSEDDEWQVMEASNIFVAPDGAHTIADGMMLTDGMQVAYGVSDSLRLNSTINGSTLTTNINDGTSNTVQGYIEQENGIIAILIGRR